MKLKRTLASLMLALFAALGTVGIRADGATDYVPALNGPSDAVPIIAEIVNKGYLWYLIIAFVAIIIIGSIISKRKTD